MSSIKKKNLSIKEMFRSKIASQNNWESNQEGEETQSSSSHDYKNNHQKKQQNQVKQTPQKLSNSAKKLIKNGQKDKDSEYEYSNKTISNSLKRKQRQDQLEQEQQIQQENQDCNGVNKKLDFGGFEQFFYKQSAKRKKVKVQNTSCYNQNIMDSQSSRNYDDGNGNNNDDQKYDKFSNNQILGDEIIENIKENNNVKFKNKLKFNSSNSRDENQANKNYSNNNNIINENIDQSYTQNIQQSGTMEIEITQNSINNVNNSTSEDSDLQRLQNLIYQEDQTNQQYKELDSKQIKNNFCSSTLSVQNSSKQENQQENNKQKQQEVKKQQEKKKTVKPGKVETKKVDNSQFLDILSTNLPTCKKKKRKLDQQRIQQQQEQELLKLQESSGRKQAQDDEQEVVKEEKKKKKNNTKKTKKKNKVEEEEEELEEGQYSRIFKFGKHKQIKASDEQYAVITADIEANLKVMACAGSGKTTTIVCRIKYLIDNGVNPSEIIIMTFNRLAGESIKYQLIKLLGSEGKIKGIRIGNIDKIAYAYYMSGVMPLNYEPSIKELSPEFLNFVQTKKGKKKVLDQYKFFFFDEFQDINEDQYQILSAFYKNGSKITVIGDDAQTIYQWRDAKLNIIQNRIDTDIEDLQVFPLNENRRSTPEIVALGNEIIQRSQLLQKDQMISLKESEYNNVGKLVKPVFMQFNNDEHQQNVLLKQLQSLIFDQKVPGEKIAIISYMNGPLLKIEAELKKHNIKNPLKMIDFIIDAKIDNQKIKPRKQKDWKQKISLCTIHCSKGLEWDYVFIIGCNDEIIPGIMAEDSPEQQKENLEERRRLMYVAVTRCSSHLYICFQKNMAFKTCSRYFSEVYKGDPQLFNIDRNSISPDEVFKTSDQQEYKQLKYITNAQVVIDKLKANDLKEMRSQNLILSQDPQKINLTCYSFELSPEINYNQYELDFDMFLRLVVQNLFQDKLKARGPKPYDIYAEKVLYTVSLSQEMFEKYDKNFKTIQTAIQQGYKLKGDLFVIQDSIESLAKKFKISPSLVRAIQEDYSYFPKNFSVKPFEDSYQRFRNEAISIDNDFQTLFRVSMLYMIFFRRQRMIFDLSAEKYFYDFMFETNPLYKQNFINALDISVMKLLGVLEFNKHSGQIFNQICIINLDYNLECKIDLIIQNTVIMIKCQDYKLDDQLTLLLWAAMYMKHERVKNNNEMVVDNVGIFNPLTQKFYGLGIQGFEHKIDQFLEYLSNKRNTITPLNPDKEEEGDEDEGNNDAQGFNTNINFQYQRHAYITPKFIKPLKKYEKKQQQSNKNNNDSDSEEVDIDALLK